MRVFFFFFSAASVAARRNRASRRSRADSARDSSSFNLLLHLAHDSSTTTAMTDDTANPTAMPTNVVAPMPFFSSKMRSRVAGRHHPKSKPHAIKKIMRRVCVAKSTFGSFPA